MESEVHTDDEDCKCIVCNGIYGIEFFISLVDGTQTKMCLFCRYKSNKNKENTTRRKVYNDLKESMQCCCICGDTNKSHLEFDHIDRAVKTATVRHMGSSEKITTESTKCRILCRKCHRKITVTEGHWRKPGANYAEVLYTSRDRNKKLVNDIKLKIGKCQSENCTDCFDPDNLAFYEWDHLNWMEKTYNIAYMVFHHFSIEEILEELEGCQLLCSYCHQIKTREDMVDRQKYFLSINKPGKTPNIRNRDGIPVADIAIEIREIYNETRLSREK